MMNSSPLLNQALAVRSKNVELRKKISDIQQNIDAMEKDIAQLQKKHDDLLAQCQSLREKQNNAQQKALIVECQRQFENYIREIDEYISNKPFILPASIVSRKIVETISSDLNIHLQSIVAPRTTTISQPKVDLIPSAPPPPPQSSSSINDDLNQQLASVENWLMESAVTDMEKTPTTMMNTVPTDDGADDLYKDLIFPTLTDEMSNLTEEMPLDENLHHQQQQEQSEQTDFMTKVSSNPSKSSTQRLDKHQRRFALMRQLAEKSNKTVTRKHL